MKKNLLIPLLETVRGRIILVLVTAVLGSVLLASSASADPDRPALGVTDPGLLALITDDDFFATADLIALLDPSATATQHYGPYQSGSPDSGTCGNDWAQDTFDRHFTVKHNPDGTFTVIQQFKNGSFSTDAGFSPGACESGPPQGAMIAGKTGSMLGYFIIPLPPGTTQTSTDPNCNAIAHTNTGCTTAVFVNTHFSCVYLATCAVTTFAFHYSAGDQQLLQHEWKNASADRGGNQGDIRSTNLP